jgi:hypothetical protein
MSKKLQLSIPKPCHENWDKMTPVQQGKFCGSCQKQVVDFSDMSDRQVAEFFKKPSTGSVCGRFMTDQLERDIQIPKKRIPWVKYFFQFVIPAFLVSIKASAQKTQGKINVTTVTKGTTNPEMRTVGLVAPVCIKPTAEEIKGDIKLTRLNGVIQLKVVNEKGDPIPYASVETGVIGKGGAADKNGLFNLDKSILNINAQLFISSVGYERKAMPVKTIANINGIFLVELKTAGWLPEVVITAYGMIKGRVMIGSVTKVKGDTIKVVKETEKKDSNIKSSVDDAKFLVYPNPVAAGTRIHASCKNFTEGYYQFRVLDVSGQLIRQSEIWIGKEASEINVPVPPTATGTYLIAVINTISGKKYVEKIIIQ